MRNEKVSLEKRIAAFNERPFWLRALKFEEGYIEQITRMMRHFGELGVIEQKPGINDSSEFPSVMYVESPVDTQPPTHATPVTKSMASARFAGLVHAKTEAPQMHSG